MTGISKIKTGDFGTIYEQFHHDGKKAIKHLMDVQEGECVAALYRQGIGDIDIVWGENNADNKGFGLKHIIEKHGYEIEQLGYKVEDFIPIIVEFGELKPSRFDDRITLESKMFRAVISKVFKINGKRVPKTFVLTAFDLRPLATKNR
jgi:hypothetical protein